MTVDDIKKEFGTLYKFMKKYNLSPGYPHVWAKKGYIPIVTQMRIERLTSGKLKASLDDCKNEVMKKGKKGK